MTEEFAASFSSVMQVCFSAPSLLVLKAPRSGECCRTAVIA